MKLLAKYNRLNIIVTIIVLLLSAVFYYFFLEAALVNQLDKSLIVEEKEFNDYVKENNQLPEPTFSKEEQESYSQITGIKAERSFSSVKIYYKEENEHILYRQLEFPVTVKGKYYLASVKKSQEETEDLVRLVLQITLSAVLTLLTLLFLINRLVLGKLWKPFHSTLKQIKNFKLASKETMMAEPTNIDEFEELNEAFVQMTKKASNDYHEIKTFTENASHEIQTPLAIIKSKLELLSQNEGLKEDQMNLIQVISETTNRLSKLNQSLLLLTKLDNSQFLEAEKIDISQLTLRLLNNYEELIIAKGIDLTKNIEPNIVLFINETLAEILITNLLTNAIKHNIDKGSIQIILTRRSLSFINTGDSLETNPSELFERFRKDKVKSDSLGLGLSIVKKICDKYGYEVTYKYAGLFHTTAITFIS